MEDTDREDTDRQLSLVLVACVWAVMVVVACVCVLAFDSGWLGDLESGRILLYVAAGIFGVASIIMATGAFYYRTTPMWILASVFLCLLSLNSTVSLAWAAATMESTTPAPAPQPSSSRKYRLSRGVDSYFEISKYLIYAMGGILVAGTLLLMVILQLVQGSR